MKLDLNKNIELKQNQTLMDYLIQNKDELTNYPSIIIEDEKEIEKYDAITIKNPYGYGFDDKEYGKLLTSKDGKHQMKIIRMYHGENYGIPKAKFYVDNVESVVNYQRMIFSDETNGYHYGIKLPEDTEYIDYIKQNIDKIGKLSLKVDRKIIEDPSKYTFVKQYDGTKGEQFKIYTPNNNQSGKRFITIVNTTTLDPDTIIVREVIENLSIHSELFKAGFPYRYNPKLSLTDAKILTQNETM